MNISQSCRKEWAYWVCEILYSNINLHFFGVLQPLQTRNNAVFSTLGFYVYEYRIPKERFLTVLFLQIYTPLSQYFLFFSFSSVGNMSISFQTLENLAIILVVMRCFLFIYMSFSKSHSKNSLTLTKEVAKNLNYL